MGKVVGADRLEAIVDAERAAGRTVALANGCFDLLHVGHVRYLAGAAAEADRLVVAVNDDDSVRALKGDGRPLHPAEERAELVAALAVVDYVVLFSGPTVARVIERIRPDVHCKGTDYTPATVPERGRGRGGRRADGDCGRPEGPFDARPPGPDPRRGRRGVTHLQCGC